MPFLNSCDIFPDNRSHLGIHNNKKRAKKLGYLCSILPIQFHHFYHLNKRNDSRWQNNLRNTNWFSPPTLLLFSAAFSNVLIRQLTSVRAHALNCSHLPMCRQFYSMSWYVINFSDKEISVLITDLPFPWSERPYCTWTIWHIITISILWRLFAISCAISISFFPPSQERYSFEWKSILRKHVITDHEETKKYLIKQEYRSGDHGAPIANVFTSSIIVTYTDGYFHTQALSGDNWITISLFSCQVPKPWRKPDSHNPFFFGVLASGLWVVLLLFFF